MTFLNSALLFGLFALIVPVVVHLLNRRRFDVVDWAAMQFLQISKKTRRKVFLEQIQLLLLRMLLIAVLVMAVAAPMVDLGCISRLPGGQRLARLAGHADRDVVLIIDGSCSMDYKWRDKTAHDEARDWAGHFLDDLSPGDRIAILQAKQRTISVVNPLTGDRDDLRAKLGTMPKPRGGVDWAKAVQEALGILQMGTNPQKEIVVLTDGQRHGWADPKSLESWELLAQGLPPGVTVPRIWVVNVVPDRPGDVPNWFISPITSNRAVATLGREVKFKFDVQLAQEKNEIAEEAKPKELPAPPEKVKFEVDGRPAGEKNPPRSREPRIGMEFAQKFSTVGSHIVGVQISEDALPGDNRRDYALEVLPSIPVLLVDGDARGSGLSRGSDFFRFAVAPANDPQPSFVLRTVSIDEFSSQLLTNPIAREPGTIPRVVVLSNVPELTDDQQKVIEEFLNRGGGVLVALGSRCAARSWNERVFRDGQGWLPARLIEPTGDENAIANAAATDPQSLSHPPLDLFKDGEKGSFLSAYFPRYWKLDTEPAGSGTAIANLTSRDPLFVEKTWGKKGRAILSAVPLDSSWRTNLIDLYDFVRLAHELLYHLAAARSGELNIAPGDQIVFRPSDGEPPGGVTIDVPEGPRRRVEVANWPFVFQDTRETGIYKLTTDSGKVQYYVVQPDTGESVLTPCDEKDRRAVQSLFPKDRFLYESDRAKMMEAILQSQNDPELWWLFLMLVIGLLAGELAYTRRLAKRSPPDKRDPP